MFLIKKIISIILSFQLLVIPSTILANTNTSTGTFTILSKGNIAPYDGILFDPYATAIILSDKEYIKDEFKLKLEYELNKQENELSLQIESLKIKFDTQDKVNKQIIESKDKEIKELRDLHINNNNLLFICGAFIAGILISVGSYYLYKKIDEL